MGAVSTACDADEVRDVGICQDDGLDRDGIDEESDCGREGQWEDDDAVAGYDAGVFEGVGRHQYS